jgi:coenzyme F420-reducing hydrogenase beta subunit
MWRCGNCNSEVSVREIVDAALAMRRATDLYDGVPALITDPAKITELSGSLHCTPIMQ